MASPKGLRQPAGDADEARKLGREAKKHWRHLDASRLIVKVLRGVRFIDGKEQADDGSWSAGDGGPDGADEGERILTTATVAGELGKTIFVRPAALDAAGEFLGRLWSPDRVQGFVLPAVAAWSVFFANVLHDLADEGLQWCGRELERGYRTGRFDPVETGRVLVACDARALPGGRVDAPELIEAVCATQRPDGSFGAPDRTYDALVVLVRLA